MESHLLDYFGMLATNGYPDLYYLEDEKGLAGVNGVYADDLLNAGSLNFQSHTESTPNLFDSKPRVNDNFDFFSTQVEALDDVTNVLKRRYYSLSLKPSTTDVTFE